MLGSIKFVKYVTFQTIYVNDFTLLSKILYKKNSTRLYAIFTTLPSFQFSVFDTVLRLNLWSEQAHQLLQQGQAPIIPRVE
jgi:hypothetical protein